MTYRHCVVQYECLGGSELDIFYSYYHHKDSVDWVQVNQEPADHLERMVSRYIDLDMPDLEAKLYSYVEALNELYWHFDIDGWEQPLRLVYYGVGDEHGWHSDNWSNDRSKLAIVCPIIEADAGGRLVIQGHSELPYYEAAMDGLVFPAHLTHRVTPVQEGERLALLGWVGGPRFQ